MKSSSYSTILGFFSLTGGPSLVSAAPTSNLLNHRDNDWTFTQCSSTVPGVCTVYIATSDDDVFDYRIAGLFDHNCNILQAIKTTKANPKIRLKGNLASFVDIYIDESQKPNGYISYLGVDTPLGNQDTLENPMACFKPPNSDGVGCQKAFSCA